MFHIEHGIEVPPSLGFGRKKYPFKDLNVGESFFVEAADDHRKRMIHKQLSTTAGVHKRKIGRTFVTRSVEGGIRVWRTAAALRYS